MTTSPLDQSVHPIRMAIVGAGFGAGIARNLSKNNPLISIVAICDANEPKATALAAELGVPVFTDVDQLLKDPSIEAIGLFTPPNGRAKLISRILQAGRHVMTTKPFEFDAIATQHVLEEAQRLGLTLHLNSPAPIDSQDIAQIRSWIQEKELGRPVGMRAETWCRYNEKPDGSWYDDPARCPVAPIFRLGIYFLNDFAPLLGTPQSVHVFQSQINTQRPTADNAQLTIRYENGALATIYASFCIGDGKPYSDRVTLNFEHGTIRRWMERAKGPDMSVDASVVELETLGNPTLSFKTQPGHFAGWYEWEAFYQAVRGIGPVPRQNPEAILFGVRLLNAMSRSAESGLPVSLS